MMDTRVAAFLSMSMVLITTMAACREEPLAVAASDELTLYHSYEDTLSTDSADYPPPQATEISTSLLWLADQGPEGFAFMRANTNKMEQKIRLVIRDNFLEVASNDWATGTRSDRVPGHYETLNTPAYPLSTNEPCGNDYRLEGLSTHKWWNEMGGGTIVWGTQEQPSSNSMNQPQCSRTTRVTNSGYYEDDQSTPYFEIDCYYCELWEAVEGGEVVEQWWECEQIDDWFCQ